MIYEASKDDFILASAIAIAVIDPDSETRKALLSFVNRTSALLFTDIGRAEMYQKKKEIKHGNQQN